MNNLSRYTFYLQAIMDVLAFILSYFIAIPIKEALRVGIRVPSYDPYINLLFVVIIGYTITAVLFLVKEDANHKTFREQILSAMRSVMIPFLILTVYLYGTKSGAMYSRIFVVIYAVLSFFMILILRGLMVRWILPLFANSKSAEKVLVIGSRRDIDAALKKMKSSKDWRMQVSGVAILDEEMEPDEYIEHKKVVSGRRNLFHNINTLEVDSILLVNTILGKEEEDLIQKLTDVGKTVYVDVREFNALPESNKYVDKVAGRMVVSFTPLIRMPLRHSFFKRLFDIFMSLLLLPLYFVVWLLSVIFSGFGTSGPAVIRLIRIGKNGRRFYKRKFRVQRMDGEERVKAGKSPYTVWGRFLKFTHLNGLPEVINVLGGDMSFCGPHAPTLRRYLKYSTERRKNLCILPGVVGRWSTSTDEDYIIRRERAYIANWSIGKDLLIYFEMFLRYISGSSTRKYGQKEFEEEAAVINDYITDHTPMAYDHSAYTAKNGPGEYAYRFIKRLVDIVLSLIGIILLSPLLLILSIAVMADDGGAPIYQQERIGLHGKKIYINKFRSMRQDAGDLKKLLTPEQLEQYRTEFKIDNDPRITKVGSFIRKTSLDELPQMFNILGGSLSIIGPRPIVEKETEIYGKDIAKFLSVKPGLTGYWQAYARNNATYESGERQAMEMYYVDHHSIWLDIKIFFKTIVSVAKREGAK
jgi:lipopolysaccharide/colanic/teichoic acid biosynthesis glycosyltransferase